ncbi:MAG: cache domain-containing protein [Arcobacteraceae bacterium]|jgi:hypothetical protein|nr:hypothetical protein [Arcobacteraceae bacterium]MDY0365948.1 cache domain-containing protein [Arcobacteraceae bacterium]
MKDLKKLTLIIIIVISVVIAYLFYNLNNIEQERIVINDLENALLTIGNLLEEEKKQALSFALLLVSDKEFIDAFLQNNREQTFEILQKKLLQLELVLPNKFKIQVHDKKLNNYIRSWSFEETGESLEEFRKGLVEVKKSKKPLVSIELGKRLNIKAIVPIIIDNEFLGSIEIITEFESLANLSRQRGYELFVLLDEQYLDIAKDLQYNKKIQNYAICNSIEELEYVNILENIDIKGFSEYGYIIQKYFLLGYFTIYDLQKKKLGYILIVKDTNTMLNLEKRGGI